MNTLFSCNFDVKIITVATVLSYFPPKKCIKIYLLFTWYSSPGDIHGARSTPEEVRMVLDVTER